MCWRIFLLRVHPRLSREGISLIRACFTCLPGVKTGIVMPILGGSLNALWSKRVCRKISLGTLFVIGSFLYKILFVCGGLKYRR